MFVYLRSRIFVSVLHYLLPWAVVASGRLGRVRYALLKEVLNRVSAYPRRVKIHCLHGVSLCVKMVLSVWVGGGLGSRIRWGFQLQ